MNSAPNFLQRKYRVKSTLDGKPHLLAAEYIISTAASPKQQK